MSSRTLRRVSIDDLLADQRRLETPVAAFARTHGAARNAPDPHYRRLIPLTKPPPGAQYAFHVDLDQCTGCKACVVACHSLNGLDDDETWREVDTLIGASFQQTLTRACHHCADPACAHGCPVLAYEKDPATGIVRHLDDQCIGCSYCVMKCPYDAPKFNRRLGIVRKCDMCQGRLAAGEAPACVQACPNEAISIRVVPVPGAGEGGELYPGSFPSGYTRPATQYVSARRRVEKVTVQASAPVVDDAHTPLAVMLILTQAAAGVLAADVVAPSPALRVTALALVLSGLAASVCHLGRPWQAWKAWLGWRRSWLSREVIALSGLAAAAAGAAAGLVPSWAAALAGLAGVFASMMVYVDTQRRCWRWQVTASRFFGSMLVCGAAVACCFDARWSFAAVSFAAGKMVLEAISLTGGWRRRDQEAALATGLLRRWLGARMAAGAAGAALLLLIAPAGVALILAGELLERSLFFRSAPR